MFHGFWRRLASRRTPELPAPPSHEEVVAAFRADPEGCLMVQEGEPHGDHQVLGGLLGVDHLKAVSLGTVLGYVQNVIVDVERREATVHHMAVAEDWIGHGLGRPLASGMRQRLVQRYRVRTITFDERHHRYEQWRGAYERLFRGLGARRVERPGDRPLWCWDVQAADAA